MTESWIVLGTYTDDAGRTIPIGMPMKDLKVHTSIFGSTGSGKSTLLKNLAIQTFGLGATTVVIEPHGDLCVHPEEGILAALPGAYLSKVVLLDLNSDYPPAIPLLSGNPGDGLSRAVAVDTAMRVLRVAESASWTTSARMREILRHSLHVLIDVLGEEANLVALGRFLAQGDYRNRILAQTSDQVGESRAYWTDEIGPMLEGKGNADVKSSIMASKRRVSIFLEDERFRRSLALPPLGPRINLTRLMDGGRLILAPLQAAELGEVGKRVFGTLLMGMVVNVFLARAGQQNRHQTVVILDEFADMAESEAGELTGLLLAQARKFGASMVLATQSPAQLDGRVRVEVSTNTNNKIILMLAPGKEDPREALNILGTDQLSPTDLANIERFHGYVRLMVHGASQTPCYIKMLPPINLSGNEDGHISAPPTPRVSRELVALHNLAKEDAEKAIERLRTMDEATFKGLVYEEEAANRWRAMTLLAEPKRMPNTRDRAIAISKHLWGLPWWLREAYYRRLRFG